MKARSLFRPKIRVIVASLLIGSLINVIIAWGIALVPLAKNKGGTQPQEGYPESTWPAGAPENESSVCYQGLRKEYVGVTRIGFSSGYWQGFTDSQANAHSLRFGLPARSLEYSIFYDFPGTTGGIRWGMLNILSVHKMLGLSNNIPTVLPIQPRPLGFAINTLVYALPVCAIWIGAASLRKRRRLVGSVCTQCGYDVSGVNQCPECGKLAPEPMSPASLNP